VSAVTRDRAEGIDADGFIVTGASASHMTEPFASVLADVVKTCMRRLGPLVRSMYVYGSVATGQAVPGVSDLDIVLIVEKALPDAVSAVSVELSDRHAEAVRGVELVAAARAEVMSEDDSALAWRCFLKHYCVCIHGEDLAGKWPRCRPSRSLVRGLCADRPRSLSDIDTDDTQLATRRGARRLLLAAAAAYSWASGAWSTDRGEGARLLINAHPERGDDTALLLRWCDEGSEDADALDLLDGYARWLDERLRTMLGE